MREISEERLKNLAKRNSGIPKILIKQLLASCLEELGEVQTPEEKNQAAIDHVASVSDHPHAAMIVKWLITGWDVKHEGSGIILEEPSWYKKLEYELVEPNPVKPAYRVYVDSDGDTFTADRLPNGAIVQTFENDITWISDWIEYDPPKRWPTPLVERIAAIDIKAAEWIVDHWEELRTPRYSLEGRFSRESSTLKGMFRWFESNVSFDVWENISTELGE